MKKRSLYILILIYLNILAGILVNTTFAQGRLILNNGGIVNITNGAFVVIDNSNPNAITRNTSGHIISEGKFNRVKWNIGNTAGNYEVPFGIGTSEYLPVSFTTSGASASGSLIFAMYPVGSWLNSANLPPGVTNFINNQGVDNSAYTIDRFWRIEPSGYTTKPALTNLVFTYRDIEWSVASNAIMENNLIAQRYNDTIDSWDDFIPVANTDISANTTTAVSLPSAQLFTWWVLVDFREILPIELTSFIAYCNGGEVQINWQTASEHNNDHFEIERSFDAIHFISVAKVNSLDPNSSVPRSYATVDSNPVPGKSYYRLKQVDKDGKFSYSSIVVVKCGNTINHPVISIYPNPSNSNLSVDIKNLSGKKSLMIYDVTGRQMIEKIDLSKEENANEVVNVSSFAKATYLLRIDVNDALYEIIKFIKN